jgi:glycosyltransferase involved in cell wall biosynthesis
MSVEIDITAMPTKVIACTPTKNRRWTYRFSRECMDRQERKADLWIVLDNSTNPEEDWTIAQENPIVKYERIEGEKPIGWLRNRCLDLALAEGADYIVFWDDDDYYPPKRISGGLEALAKNPDADLAGSSLMYLLVVPENALLTTGPFHDRHATAATWTLRRKTAEQNRFDPDKTKGEEVTFTKDWALKVAQVNAEECIVVMGHNRNTVNKSDVYKRPRIYNGEIKNEANGKMVFRVRWPVPWDIWKATFSV